MAMRIVETPEGWTVKTDSGKVRLYAQGINDTKIALFRPTKIEVIRICERQGFFEGKDGILYQISVEPTAA